MQDFIENFFEILEDTDKNQLNPQTDFKNLEEWDSMLSLMLIAMVDEKYDKQIGGSILKDCTTLEELYNIIKSK
jgi:acyl carrier protein